MTVATLGPREGTNLGSERMLTTSISLSSHLPVGLLGRGTIGTLAKIESPPRATRGLFAMMALIGGAAPSSTPLFLVLAFSSQP